tara:strand:- start:7272 stop:8552 length:1281 start_codon:yes stop_codon:yes gene_type:complete
MPNFEYYRKEYLGTAQKRYEQAMAMAYRDLLLEYKDAAMAREALQSQMNFDEKIRTKQLELLTKASKSKSNTVEGMTTTQFITGSTNYEAAVRQVEEWNTDLWPEARKQWNKENQLTTKQRADIETFIHGPLTDVSGSGETIRFEMESAINNHLIPLMESLNDSQRETLVSDYGPRIKSKLRIDMEVIEEVFKAPYIEEADKSAAQERFEQNYYDTNKRGLTAPMQKMGRILGIEGEEELTRIEGKKIVTPTATATEPTAEGEIEVVAEREGLPLPTPEKIRERAAQYYAPFASPGFQEAVGFKEPAPPKAKAKPEIAEEDIEIAAIEGLPPFAGKLFGVSSEVEAIVDLDDDAAIKRGGLGAEYGSQLLRGGDDYQSAVGKIETNDSLDETQKGSAYAMLARDLYRNWQEQSKVPSLEEVVVSRG